MSVRLYVCQTKMRLQKCLAATLSSIALWVDRKNNFFLLKSGSHIQYGWTPFLRIFVFSCVSNLLWIFLSIILAYYKPNTSELPLFNYHEKWNARSSLFGNILHYLVRSQIHSIFARDKFSCTQGYEQIKTKNADPIKNFMIVYDKSTHSTRITIYWIVIILIIVITPSSQFKIFKMCKLRWR